MTARGSGSRGTPVVSRYRLPARNAGVASDIPGYLELHRQRNGLIHGCKIWLRGGHTVTVRAFRVEKIAGAGPAANTVDVVVAGVCELRDPANNTLSRWSTAKALGEYFTGVDSPLPPEVWEWDAKKQRMVGHYMPENHIQKALPNLPTGPDRLVSPDNGRPDRWAYNRENARPLEGPTYYYYSYHYDRGEVTHADNPFYDQTPTATEGFVNATPYVLVFSPGEQPDSVIVSMRGIHRRSRLLPGTKKRVLVDPGWATRTIRKP